MASVQLSPAMQHHGAPMPAGATKQQAEEVFRVSCRNKAEAR